MSQKKMFKEYDIQGYKINCEIYEIEKPSEGFVTIPIDDDITFYGMLTDGNALCCRNDEACIGHFYVHFYKYTSKADVDSMLFWLLQSCNALYSKTILTKRHAKSISTNEQYNSFIDNCKFVIHKYIEKNDNTTYYAIAMINSKKKCNKIKNANIKTILCECVPVLAENSWDETISEMVCAPYQSECTTVEKHEVLDFEARQLRVQECVHHMAEQAHLDCTQMAIALADDSASFFAYQLSSRQGETFANYETQEYGKVYNLRNRICGSLEESNILAKKLIEIFRSVFGTIATQTVIYYTKVNDNRYDVSIGICKKQYNIIKNAEEEESF